MELWDKTSRKGIKVREEMKEGKIQSSEMPTQSKAHLRMYVTVFVERAFKDKIK